MLAPSNPHHYPRLHISSFGVIPRKGQPGKWRLIVDLSSPGGASVNDGIDPQLFTLQYITVDRIIRMVANYGPGTVMAKFDVEAAYRNSSRRTFLARHEVEGSILCGPGPPLWSAFSAIHFQLSGRYGRVDSP